MTKAEFHSLQAQVRILAMSIGLRPAARACGLSEDRVRNWSSRQRWGIASLPSACAVGYRPDASKTPTDTNPVEATAKVIEHYGNRAKIAATIAGARALEHLADTKQDDVQSLVAPAKAIAADQWTKAVDRAAGWTQARMQGGTTVNIANIIPPSAEDRAQRAALDAKLDAITHMLGDSAA